jgi:nucleotide-binding universal stress UspA family protein
VSDPRFRRIVAAVDGSPHADAALDAAIDLARHYNGELTVLGVAPLVPVYIAPTEPMVPGGIPTSEITHYREIVEAGVKRATAAGLTAVTGVTYEGVVIDEILAHVEKHPCDLIVIGSRGLSIAKRILIGSVSTGVVTHAPCPVLVVRGPVTPPHG